MPNPSALETAAPSPDYLKGMSDSADFIERLGDPVLANALRMGVEMHREAALDAEPVVAEKTVTIRVTADPATGEPIVAEPVGEVEPTDNPYTLCGECETQSDCCHEHADCNDLVGAWQEGHAAGLKAAGDRLLQTAATHYSGQKVRHVRRALEIAARDFGAKLPAEGACPGDGCNGCSACTTRSDGAAEAENPVPSRP